MKTCSRALPRGKYVVAAVLGAALALSILAEAGEVSALGARLPQVAASWTVKVATAAKPPAAGTGLAPLIAEGDPGDQTARVQGGLWFSIYATGTAPLFYQWYKDGQKLVDQTNANMPLSNLRFSDAGKYWVVITNLLGSAKSREAQLTILPPQPGSIDLSFRSLDFRGSANAVFLQPDGRILVSGDFVRMDGTRVDHVARLLSDGVLDNSYDTEGNVASYCDTCVGELLAVQPDGKALMNGSGIGFGRLRLNGRRDFTTVPDLYSAIGCALQPDGQFIVGAYEYLGGANSRTILRRVREDGVLDTNYTTPVIMTNWYAYYWKYHLTAQADNRLLVGGWFTLTHDERSRCLVRLNSDGALDSGYHPPFSTNDTITALLLQPDGKLIVAGHFPSLGDEVICYRLNTNGSVDSTFRRGLVDRGITVTCLALQDNGKILAAISTNEDAEEDPWINHVGGLARLLPNGEIDEEFISNWPLRGTVAAIAVQTDGRILVGGSFVTTTGIYYHGLARLHGDDINGEAFVERQLPLAYVPRAKILVKLDAKPAATIQVYAVEEQFPAGWIVGAISHEGVYDAVNRKIKWGPFFDHQDRVLTYEVTPPEGDSGPKLFVGQSSADGRNLMIDGTSQIDSAPLYHPADRVPVDNRLVMAEVTAYGFAWRKGDTWPVAPNPIPIDYVTRAAALWKGGEFYAYRPGALPPLCWVNATNAAGTAGPTADGLFAVDIVSAGAKGAAVAEGPALYLNNEVVIISIMATPAPTASAYAVEERIPSGWVVSSLNEGGEWDALNAKIKWGPFMDNTARKLTYQARTPSASVTRLDLVGSASFDGVSVPITGRRCLRVSCRLLGIERVAPGRAQIRLDAIPLNPRLESTVDFLRWIPVNSPLLLDGAIEFDDAGTAPISQRFYRVNLGAGD